MSGQKGDNKSDIALQTGEPSRLLWITWKDHLHPLAGGAEVVAHELTTRWARDGKSVTILTARYPGAAERETIDGVDIIRVGGNRYLLPVVSFWYYFRNLRNQYDVLIEEVEGSAPYFAVVFEKKARKFLLYHQLGRINWLYEVPKVVGVIGYWFLVPFVTWLASLSRTPVITVSESTRKALAPYGMAPERTHIISEGLQDAPLVSLDGVKKFAKPTLLSFGAMRAMKRTIDQVKAFELAKQTIPDLQMKLAGSASGSYGQEVLAYIAQSPHTADIEYLGRVDDEAKASLMRRSHAILVTSIEEGWGLVVSEANGQGTPAVVYDVAGLRDSTLHRKTGIVTAENPRALAAGAVELLQNTADYERMRVEAWEFSKTLTFTKSYADFCDIVEP